MADLSTTAQETLAGLRGQLAALADFLQLAEVSCTQTAASLRIQFYSESAGKLEKAASANYHRCKILRIATEQMQLQCGEVETLLQSALMRLSDVYLADRDLQAPRKALEESFNTASSLEIAKRALIPSVEELERQLEAESKAISQSKSAEFEAKANIVASEEAREALLTRKSLQLSELPALQQENASLQEEVTRLEQEFTHIEKINAHIGERKAILQHSLQTLSANLRMARQKSRADWRRRLALGHKVPVWLSTIG